jgi:hypothetical protein
MSNLLINELTISDYNNTALKRHELNSIHGGVTVENCDPKTITQKPDGTVIITCK